jgi:hypothetical protein
VTHDDDEAQELRAIVRAAAGIGDLDGSVNELTEEVRGLRADITRHPDLDEVVQRVGVVSRQVRIVERRLGRGRRKSAFWLAVSIVAAVELHDQHIDRCGAGSSLNTPARVETVQTVAEKDAVYHFLCDAATPLHTHDGDPYPSGGNVAGWALYSLAATGGWVWVRRARTGKGRLS